MSAVRRLTAILAVNVVGHSRLMDKDKAGRLCHENGGAFLFGG